MVMVICVVTWNFRLAGTNFLRHCVCLIRRTWLCLKGLECRRAFASPCLALVNKIYIKAARLLHHLMTQICFLKEGHHNFGIRSAEACIIACEYHEREISCNDYLPDAMCKHLPLFIGTGPGPWAGKFACEINGQISACENCPEINSTHRHDVIFERKACYIDNSPGPWAGKFVFEDDNDPMQRCLQKVNATFQGGQM